MLGLRRVQVWSRELLSSNFGSRWASVPKAPPDSILGLTTAFNEDKAETKVLLGAGAYRDDNGKPFVLNAVRKAERTVVEGNLDKEYTTITGVPAFVDAASKFLFGSDSDPLTEGRVVASQSLSGTGSLRLAGEFLNRFSEHKSILVPKPTWPNHNAIMRDAGLQVEGYTYLDSTKTKLDFDAMIKDLAGAPKGSNVLLHSCAHNPTGVDPDFEQWKSIGEVCKDRGHMVLFDTAYQGFASGDADRDAAAIRHFVKTGHDIMVTQSFAKNMGMYGERVGGFYIVTDSPETKAAVESQVKVLIRPMYSTPPVHGARIVANVLSDESLKSEWLTEMKGMADRIIEARTSLRKGLEAAGSTHDWSHITNQIGMFCYLGIPEDAVNTLREKHHVYMTQDGRISMAGVNSKNVEYIAKALHAVTA